MHIELLVVPGCPNATPAAELLWRVLRDMGLPDVTVGTRVITGHAAAEAAHFAGSPTYQVGGHDLFAEPGQTVGLTCRVYRTPDGLAPIPTAEELREALSGALQTPRRTDAAPWERAVTRRFPSR